MTRKIVILTILIAIIVAAGLAIILGKPAFNYRYAEAVIKDTTIKIYPQTTIEKIAGDLERAGVVEDSAQMVKFHKKHKLEEIKVGNYALEKGMTYHILLSRLANGRQTPVRLTFNNVRTLEQLAGRFARYTIGDSTTHIDNLRSKQMILEIIQMQITQEQMPAFFMPDTYEIYWTDDTFRIAERLLKHSKNFWNNTRVNKAEKLGFNAIEIATIASIVTEETNDTKEMTDVAGVYINRLRRAMPLQADPTVKFAIRDFTIKRILNKHLKYQSPYNTYINSGLPPGPICLPSAKVIDKVLDYKGHEYLYFCAKEDFSGSHAFAKNLAQHSQNAARYHQALNKAKIR